MFFHLYRVSSQDINSFTSPETMLAAVLYWHLFFMPLFTADQETEVFGNITGVFTFLRILKSVFW
jgi:hypothetical protein